MRLFCNYFEHYSQIILPNILNAEIEAKLF